MEIITLIVSLIVLVLVIVLLFKNKGKRDDNFDEVTLLKVKEELKNASDESFRTFQQSFDRDMHRLANDSNINLQKADESLRLLNNLSSNVLTVLKNESESQNNHFISINNTLNQNFDRVREENRASFALISEKSEKLNSEVKNGMDKIREGNEAKLKEIQNVVDQKLQETLDKRISASFASVSENLTKLYKAMGTLDSLSLDVKKMNALFSNVKTRGVWGEMQAESILSDILTPDQWVKNYSPRSNRENVEFAIRMPGKEGEVYLPIDSKFPTSDFERYKNAIDSGNEDEIKEESKKIRTRLLDEAKDINKKYIVPPFTTDFAILFLPSETLYLEALKMDGLSEKMQNECRVVLTGPNNFAALLNSLSLGFRTMQIEEYTSTIWHLFEDLKKLFSDLSKSVDESKKHVDKASESLDSVKRRKEKIGSVLTKIESSAEKAALKEINDYYLEEKDISQENSGNE